ncbi:MAG: RNA pseudouridine synthase [Gammaproteobacteria bacterium]|nr:RNA pseudouridine synthase [Gammaproteobacteria bacterium]
MSELRTKYHIEVTDDGASPVDLLAAESGLSKQKIKQAMQKGAVWLTDDKGTHRLRRQSKKPKSGSKLHFYYDPEVLDETVDDAILIADEGDYSVWYKPRGMLSQGSKWSDHCAINRWVEQHGVNQHSEPQRQAFIVHRLDRFASGLILIAHKKKTATLLADLFKKKNITKQYKAIVHGLFPRDAVTLSNEVDNKPAVSHVSLLQYEEVTNTSLVQVDIETGRKHQIRIHLSGAGFPIVGDRLYGSDDGDKDLQLTAFKLSFPSPIDGTDKIYTLSDELQPKLNNISD